METAREECHRRRRVTQKRAGMAVEDEELANLERGFKETRETLVRTTKSENWKSLSR